MDVPPLPPSITDQMNEPDKRAKVIGEIAEFLVTAPLYRKLKCEGDLWALVGRKVSFLLPSILKMHCPDGECQRSQLWDRTEGLDMQWSAPEETAFLRASFRCRNCQRSVVTYFVGLDVEEDWGKLTKVGQWPPLSRETDPIVVAGWSKADKLLYRDALTFRNSNKGIAALPYLRRVIENHIHDVLGLIGDAHKRSPIPNFDEPAFQAARTSHRFSDKLDFARDFLPVGLTPGGQPNPIGMLYELISDGLHRRSEDECVAIFDRCKGAFEFVVRKLTDAKRDDEEYVETIRKLNLRNQ